jgi:deoxyribodipyrimidine photo-lyase
MSTAPSIVWFRNDLRLRDNPALRAAINAGGAVVPVFIWAPEEEGDWAPGAASRWWLHRSLAALDGALRERNSRLILLRGPSLEALLDVAMKTGARSIYFNRRYEPFATARDGEVIRGLHRADIETDSFNASLLFEPWKISNRSGGPYQLYTPFWRACLAAPAPAHPDGAPRGALVPPSRWPRGVSLGELDLDPRAQWTDGLQATWQPGEPGALRQIRRFTRGPLGGYSEQRDRPDISGTSRLSPHLRFGEIGPRQVWSTLERVRDTRPEIAELTQRSFARQILWREFGYHLLYHFPHTTDQPLRRQFARLARNTDRAGRAAWEKGRTGYPIVDAGMRELLSTGWMHNRVRMVVASFLVKDLLAPWQVGAVWFWETLVDADLANNTLGWQWAAGCGADAAPFFRIFNPVRQGMRFDPEGDYVRHWIPEIARLPARWVHRPFEATDSILEAAGIRLGSTYPRPVVDHEERRVLALSAYQSAMNFPRMSH